LFFDTPLLAQSVASRARSKARIRYTLGLDIQ